MAYCNLSHYSPYHILTFILTFFSYSCLHATRKSFSNVKPVLLEEWTPTFQNSSLPELYPTSVWNSRHLFNDYDSAETFLGTLDMIFMFSYAVGLFISGYVAERLNHRFVLTFGMISSAIIVVIFGVVTEWLHFYNIYFYILIWILNGLCQSCCWPTAVAIMGNWFGENKGLIFGIWSACASVGNIMGGLLCGAVLDYGYEFGFLVPASLLFAGGVVCCCGIINHPKEIGLNLSSSNDSDYDELIDDSRVIDDSTSSNGILTDTEPLMPVSQPGKAIGFFEALLIPGVIPYALAYAFLKLVNYSFFFWLPTYLHDKYKWSESYASVLSSYYDFGGIVGGTIAGVVSDFMWARSPITVGFLWISVPVTFLYSRSPSNESINALLMWFTGFFIGGPANVISATIMADLGKNKDLAGSKDAFAMVTGIVDGIGSIGAGIGQICVPLIQENASWDAMFYFFMSLSFSTTVCIFPVLYKDIKEKCTRRVTEIHDS